MPLRKIPLINKEVYHIVNRGVASMPIFKTSRDYSRFINTFIYYQYQSPPIKYSKFRTLSQDRRKEILRTLKRKNNFIVEIICYCVMPNHFHLLLKQLKNNGIVDFIRLTTNSYSRYFNTKNKRKGPLMEGRFLNVRIETDEQLLHVNRYIHLNPYSSFIVKDFRKLLDYSYSSLPEYLRKDETQICKKDIILKNFKSKNKYLKFIKDNADYQRSLETIKHKLLD